MQLAEAVPFGCCAPLISSYMGSLLSEPTLMYLGAASCGGGAWGIDPYCGLSADFSMCVCTGELRTLDSDPIARRGRLVWLVFSVPVREEVDL